MLNFILKARPRADDVCMPKLTTYYGNGKQQIKNPFLIAEKFNDFFSKIASKTKQKIPHTDKHFSDCMSEAVNASIFLQPTNAEEIQLIISSLTKNTTYR